MRMAAYCRVSTTSIEQINSIKNQESFFKEYAKKCNAELVKIYADEGISGKQMQNRTEFIQLLSDSKKNLFDIVVTKDISRFARNTADFLVGIRELKKNNIDVRFLSNNQTLLGDSEFVLTLFAALAQQESESLSKRVIFGKKQSAKKGRTPNLIYGYDKTGTYSLKKNECESKIVELIFHMYSNLGAGSRKIAKFLNDRAFPTKKGGMWNPKTVIRILKNPIYIGILKNNKSQTDNFLYGTRKNLPENEWNTYNIKGLKIVEDEVYYKAQEILALRKSNKIGYKSNELFYKLVCCKRCNATLTRQNNDNLWLICKKCGLKINYEYLKNQIFEFLNNLVMENNLLIKKNTIPNCIISKNNTQKSNLINLYKNGFITFKKMQKQFDEINNNTKEIINNASFNFDYSNYDLRILIDKIIIDEEINVIFK